MTSQLDTSEDIVFLPSEPTVASGCTPADHVARLEPIKEMKPPGFTAPQTCQRLEARDALRGRPTGATDARAS